MAALTLNDIRTRASAYRNKPEMEKQRDAAFETLDAIPAMTRNAVSNLPSNLWNTATQIPQTAENIITHPINSERDLLGGVARGSQNLASALLQSGEYATRKGTEGLLKLTGKDAKVPYWNAREFMGLEGKNPVDLGGMIESENPDPLISGFGQYGLGSSSLGSRLPNLIKASAITSAINAHPGERMQSAIEGAVNVGIPALGGKLGMAGLKSAVPYAKAGIDYMQPGKAAEEYRSTLGEGTSKENIAKIGSNVKSSYQEQLAKALEPKEKLFSKYKESPLVNNQKSSEYLTDEDVTKYYQRKGDLLKKHEAYADQPIVKNYDSLQSALKKEVRQIEGRAFIGDAAEAKLNQLKLNIKNLDEDVSKWSETLPEEDKNLEKEWRTLYRENIGPYENAPEPLKKLAEGRWEEVKPAEIGSVFTHMTKETQKIFGDLPPETSKMILYNAIQKVPSGDAGALADTILDLKNTKGYDRFVTKDIEDWATNMQKHAKYAGRITDALKLATGSAAGGMVGGSTGAVVGAALPFVKEGAIKIAKKFKK